MWYCHYCHDYRVSVRHDTQLYMTVLQYNTTYSALLLFASNENNERIQNSRNLILWILFLNVFFYYFYFFIFYLLLYFILSFIYSYYLYIIIIIIIFIIIIIVYLYTYLCKYIKNFNILETFKMNQLYKAKYVFNASETFLIHFSLS